MGNLYSTQYNLFYPRNEPTAYFPPIQGKRDFSKLEESAEAIRYSVKIIWSALGLFEAIPGYAYVDFGIGLISDSLEKEVDEKIKKYVDVEVTNSAISQELQLFEDRVYDVEKRMKSIATLNATKKQEADQMRIEITCAMSSCAQIYHRFEQIESIFYKHPLSSPKFLSLFSKIYIQVLRIAGELCPTPYGSGNEKQEMIKLITT